uniref:Serine threonine protein kinase n=1 Tax=Marseillevirus sp. TaxID=2809551 RepID=A0AA96ESS9_9VIRU|nr:serine threonine protein kinase [Marseillevirus sp.]
MGSVIKVEAEGKTLFFRGEDDIDAQYNLDLWVESKEFALRPKQRRGEYLKFCRMYGEGEPEEVEIYRHLDGTELTPKLLRHGNYFSFTATYGESGLVLNHSCAFIGIERFGKSLEEIFGSSPETMLSSKDMLKDRALFDRAFPPEKFPQEIRESVLELATCLESEGIDHQDFHSGNILMDKHGVTKVIDFECVSINL